MIVAWVCFFTLSMVVYGACSDGDFSFLLTYAACCRSFAFFLLNFRMFASKSGASQGGGVVRDMGTIPARCRDPSPTYNPGNEPSDMRHAGSLLANG